MKKLYGSMLGMFCCLLVPGIYYSHIPLGLFTCVGSYVSYPFLKFQQNIIDRLKLFLTQQYSLYELQTQLASTVAERDKYLADYIQLKSSIDYMHDIQELREFNQKFENKGIVTQVLMRHFSHDSHYFLLDAGSNKGITVDMVVIYNNCLVGKVSDVYPWFCKVRLITDRSCKVSSYCTASQVYAIHEGLNDEAVTQLSFISHLSALNAGDLVLSSGEGLIFPRGFALGHISTYAPDGLFYKVSVKPLLDFKTVTYCSIIPKIMTIDNKLH